MQSKNIMRINGNAAYPVLIMTWRSARKFPNSANFPRCRLEPIVTFQLLIVRSVIIEEKKSLRDYYTSFVNLIRIHLFLVHQ